MPSKIAILRGANLNKFEMQTFELLADKFDITAFHLKGNNFDPEDIKLRTESVWGMDSFIPRYMRRYYYFAFSHILEINQPMVGLKKRLRGYDIVHSADMGYFYTYQAAKHKNSHGYKLVLTIAENIPFLFGKRGYSRKRIEKIIRKVDIFLPLTQRAAEALTLQGVSSDRIKVIPFGIDISLFRPWDEETGTYYKKFSISKEDFIILYIGRLSRSKGLFELIFAAKKILTDTELNGRNVIFVLVGSGPIRRKMESLVHFLGIAKNFRIIKGRDYSEMPGIHNLADIFVLPSIVTSRWQEQFGMVLIESMACGKPIVSTLSGSIPEVVGEAGLLVQPSDHYSLYQAIKTLILSDNLRTQLGKLARRRALDNFDSKLVARKIMEVYQSL
jgi:glycosyltransferase involved in cell wall biosynthesis